MSNHSTNATASRTGRATEATRVAATKPCPFCRKNIGVISVTCGYCHRPVPAPAVPAEIAAPSVMPYRKDESTAPRSAGTGLVDLIRGLFL